MKKITAQFTEKLYKHISDSRTENLVLSPLSVICAAALVGGAASGETLSEIESVLGEKLGELDDKLYGISCRSTDQDTNAVKTANSIWTNGERLYLSEKFADHARKYYSADCRSASFSSGEAVKMINAWVSEKTDGMITDALDSVDPSTVVILLNTILFDGRWEKKFSDVVPGEFYSYDGSTVQADFMHSSENSYFEVDGASGFSKKYAGGYRFTAVLPDGDIRDYIQQMDIEKILDASEFADCRADISLPKFDYENKIELTDTLKKLGMRRALSSSAELYGLSEDSAQVYIDEIVQKSRIIMNEHGTKAAAMTEMAIALAMFPHDIKTVFLNRPFIYLITDQDGVILFIGTVYSI